MAKLVFATRYVLISMVDDEDQWYKSESASFPFLRVDKLWSLFNSRF